MAKMFKLMENELDKVYASFSHVSACVKNVETLADYILENDDKNKYTLEMLNLTENLSQDMFRMGLRIEGECEKIEKIKNQIADLY